MRDSVWAARFFTQKRKRKEKSRKRKHKEQTQEQKNRRKKEIGCIDYSLMDEKGFKMMKKSVPILCCVLLVICVFSFVSFTSGKGEAKNNKALVGSWIEVDGNNAAFMIQFTDKGILRCCINRETDYRKSSNTFYDTFRTFLYSYDENSNILSLAEVINGKTTDKPSERVCYIEGDGMMLAYPYYDEIRLYRRA